MANTEGSRNCYLPRDVANVLQDTEIRAILGKMGSFLKQYCFWKKDGQEFLNYNPDLKRAIEELMK